VITISYPKANVGRIEMKLPHVPGKALRSYFKEAGLESLRMRHAVMRPKTRERLTNAHEPRDGETILVELAGRAMS
jgi:hypothetical protein